MSMNPRLGNQRTCATPNVADFVGEDSLKVKVISWNILADHCLKFHDYVNYEPNERNDLLKSILKAWMAKDVDFICLQEVDSGSHRFIEEHVLNGQYRVLSTHGSQASCICYKADTWILSGEKHVVQLNDLAISLETVNKYNLARQFHKNKYGLFAKFQHLRTSQEIVVATTQFSWEPELEHVKICQCHYLFQRIKEFMNTGSLLWDTICKDPVPLLFAGDLNAQPGSVCHYYLTSTCTLSPRLEEIQDAAKVAEKMYNLLDGAEKAIPLLNGRARCPAQNLRSAYASPRKPSMEERYPFTNVTDKFTGFLDYIFYDSYHLYQTKFTPLPKSIEELQALHGSTRLPSHQWPSDHLAIGAEFVFKEKPKHDESSWCWS